MKIPRTLLALALASLLPLALAGCPKKEVAATPDAAPAPTATQAETILAPLEDDAGDEADAADASKPKWKGPGMSATQLHARQCCDAIRKQARTMGTAPEAAQLSAAAAMCDQAAMSLGPTVGAQAPEFAQLRAMMQGKTLPPVCQGL